MTGERAFFCAAKRKVPDPPPAAELLAQIRPDAKDLYARREATPGTGVVTEQRSGGAAWWKNSPEGEWRASKEHSEE
jgi:hypothetical protein